jgi:small subunit ribosomal protein S21
MLVVEVKNDNVEKAIRKLRKKVIQTKQLKNLKERKEYTKKSVKRRNEIQKASYIQKKYGDDY